MTHSAIPAKAGIQCNMERGTRTLQRQAARPCLNKEREARAFYAGFLLSQEWQNYVLPL